MFLINCPYCGERDQSEFSNGGEAHVKRPENPDSISDKEWAEYVFYHNNGTGVVREWWLHAPSGYWFIAERHRVSDEVVRTYDPSELEQSEFFAAPPADVQEARQ